MKTANLIHLAYVAAGLMVFYLAWLPVELSVFHFLYEDFFYYLKIADNIIHGHGVTLDGVARTNGFHPLWLLICLAGTMIAKAPVVIHLVLSVAAVLHILQGLLIFRILSMEGNKSIAHATALFWLFNYRVAVCNLCGLETPLVVTLLLAILYVLRQKPVENKWHILTAGAMLGLAVLSRFDLLLLLPFAGIIIMIDRRSNQCLRVRFSRAVLTCVTAVVCLVPWFLWSYTYSGTMLPNSKTALEVCGKFGLNLHQPFLSLISEIYAKFSQSLWWLTDTANMFGIYPLVLSNPPVSTAVSIVLLLLFLVIFAVLLAQREEFSGYFYQIMFAWSMLHLGYYIFFANAEVRYLMPCCAVVVIVVSVIVSSVLRKFKMLTRAFSAVFLLLFLSASLSGTLAWRRCQGSTRSHVAHDELYETACSLRLNLRPEVVVGSWNAGILSYFSGLTVVNLDGVVNDDAISANRKKELGRYIKERGIRYLVDFNFDVVRFMDNFSGEPNWRLKYQPVFEHRYGRVVVLRRID